MPLSDALKFPARRRSNRDRSSSRDPCKRSKWSDNRTAAPGRFLDPSTSSQFPGAKKINFETESELRQERIRDTYTSAKISKRKIESSHFFAFPLHIDSNLRQKVGHFQKVLLDGGVVKGLDPSIIVDPRRLHITVGVVGLRDDLDLNHVINLVSSLQPKMAQILKKKKTINVKLDKLDITQPVPEGDFTDQFAHVLFIGPSDSYLKTDDGKCITLIMDIVYDELYASGFISEKRSSKVHCSILNTRYRRPRGSKLPFSYSDVLASPACQYLSLETAPKSSETARVIELCDVEVGEIQLWKFGSHTVNNEYICCGRILLSTALIYNIPTIAMSPVPQQQLEAVGKPQSPPLSQSQVTAFHHDPPTLQPPAVLTSLLPQQKEVSQLASLHKYQLPQGALRQQPTELTTWPFNERKAVSHPENPTSSQSQPDVIDLHCDLSPPHPLPQQKVVAKTENWSHSQSQVAALCPESPFSQSLVVTTSSHPKSQVIPTVKTPFPQILKISEGDPRYILFLDIFNNWGGNYTPNIMAVYNVQPNEALKAAFDNYQRGIEATGRFFGYSSKSGQPMLAGNEKTLYFGAKRTCPFGDRSVTPCTNKDCELCLLLCSGFKCSPKSPINPKSMFPIVVYGKASKAVSNIANSKGAGGSHIKVLIMCRVVLGRPLDTPEPEKYRACFYGYDSFFRLPVDGSSESFDEFHLYNVDALCITGLIVSG